MSKFKKYRILYTFHDSKMGFQNSITLTELNLDSALENAKKEVEKCFGKNLINKFSFKPDPSYSGIVI